MCYISDDSCLIIFNSSRPGHNGRLFADDIFRCIFVNFSVFWLKFHWSLFLMVRLIITQHWFRYWLDAAQTTSHYLNQCWPDSLTHTCGSRGRWVNAIFCLDSLQLLWNSGNRGFHLWVPDLRIYCNDFASICSPPPPPPPPPPSNGHQGDMTYCIPLHTVVSTGPFH